MGVLRLYQDLLGSIWIKSFIYPDNWINPFTI